MGPLESYWSTRVPKVHQSLNKFLKFYSCRFSASAPAIPPGNNSANISAPLPSLPLLSNPAAALLQGANTQDYLNILQQQLLQQQLAAYAANIAAATGQQHPLAAQNFNAASLAAAAQQQVFWILEF